MCFRFIFVIAKKDCSPDLKVYLTGRPSSLSVKVDNSISYWRPIFRPVGNTNSWTPGANLMTSWFTSGNILYLRTWLKEVFLEFSGGSHASPITPGVLITFFTFGLVSKLMYNEDYSSLGKGNLPFTNIIIQFYFYFFCVIKHVWIYYC